jgi:putative DNA primase/helicase
VLDRANPLPTAREFVAAYHFHADSGRPTLLHWRGDTYTWNGCFYCPADPQMMRAELYGFLEDAVVVKMVPDGEGGQKKAYAPFKPKPADIDATLDAVRAIVVQHQSMASPGWLHARPGDDVDDPRQFVAVQNGLLHLESESLAVPDPDYFALSGLSVKYENGPRPEAWHAFLDSIFEGDDGAKRNLQRLFGYLLASDTRFQKVFLMVGPKRSGKGTIARVLHALLGRENVAGPTLNALGQNFGLQSLIGKPLAIISDARLSGRADQAAITERLLSISGEDALSIPRKHKADWIGSLPTRFLILTNELPSLQDQSGALASRFVVWTLNKSFYGCEDHNLTERLLAELPGILRWALVGYQRLYQRGRFEQHESGEQAIEELETLGSPVATFVKEKCEVEAGAEVRCDPLYESWRSWCDGAGRKHPGTKANFGRDLRAVVPGLTTKQRREAYDGNRYRAFIGIRFKRLEETDGF